MEVEPDIPEGPERPDFRGIYPLPGFEKGFKRACSASVFGGSTAKNGVLMVRAPYSSRR